MRGNLGTRYETLCARHQRRLRRDANEEAKERHAEGARKRKRKRQEVAAVKGDIYERTRKFVSQSYEEERLRKLRKKHKRNPDELDKIFMSFI